MLAVSPSVRWFGLLAGLAVSLALLPALDAGGRAKSGAAGDNTASAVAQLNSVTQLLQQADKDYGGHRAKAVQLVQKAIHELQSKPASTGQAPKGQPAAKGKAAGKGKAAEKEPKAKGAGKKHKEAQGVSDGQLNKAIQMISATQSKLSSQHADAKATLQVAIQELKAALKVK
jgi:hypothetical protein